MTKSLSTDREAKRSRFVQGKATPAPPAAGRSSAGRPLWYGVAAVAMVLTAVAIFLLLGNRAPAAISASAGPAAQGAASAAATAGPSLAQSATPILPAAPAAATHGHAPYPEAVPVEGEIRLEVAPLADDVARHYTYMADGKPIEFFAVRASDGTIRTAYNACDVCFAAKLGYTQDGDVMICNNCGRRFPADQVGLEQGGCNPSPLPSRMVGGLLTIKTSDLAQGSRFF